MSKSKQKNTPQTIWIKFGPGYQKALERGNSVPRPKGLCEADKVKLFAVLLHDPKCNYLRINDTLMKYRFLLELMASLKHSVKGPPSLREAWPPYYRLGLPVRGPQGGLIGQAYFWAPVFAPIILSKCLEHRSV